MTQQHPPPYGQPDPRQWQDYGQSPPPLPPKKRKWPWVVGGFLLLFVVAAIGGGNQAPPAGLTPAAPSATPLPAALPTLAPLIAAPTLQTVVAAPPAAAATPTRGPTTVTLPPVKGRNGGIVYDELRELGLTKVELASADEDHTVVLAPQNWTVLKIEPAAGTTVRTNQTVVVTMTKD